MAILIIGYGAIASYVVDKLADAQETAVRWVLCRAGRAAAARAALGSRVAPVTALDQIADPVELAIECAGHAGLAQHGPVVLAAGIDLICASTGALADDALARRLADAARQGGARLQLVSGAVGAVDALTAAKAGRLDRVVYRGRKPPAGWKGSPAEAALDLDALTEPACHFAGNARDAALGYPKNANVAATVALAGRGLDATAVELIADPTVAGNIHEIEAEGDFGRMHFRIEGKPLPSNPRSSALTAMSIVTAVRNRRAALGF